MFQAAFSANNLIMPTKRSNAQVLSARESFNRTHYPSVSDFSQTSTNFNHLRGLQFNRYNYQNQIKRRYQKIIELQHQSFIERHELEKEREQFIKREQQKVEARTKELRDKMGKLGQSTRQIQFRNRIEGAELRQQRIINHRFCVERDSHDLERKKKAVSHQNSFRVQSRTKKGPKAGQRQKSVKAKEHFTFYQ